MLDDDKRQAASAVATLSASVATAALAAVAGLIALFTYLSQNFKVDACFYVAVAGAGLCFVLSFVCSGLGTKELAEKVAAGTWKVEDRIWPFNFQTWLAVAGIVLIAAATVIAVKAPKATDTTALNLQHVTERVAVLETELKNDESSAFHDARFWSHRPKRERHRR
jgi:amino acid transporter